MRRRQFDDQNATVTPVKILHVFERMNRGGAEMRTLDVMRKIDRDKFRLEFCVLSGLPGELDNEIRDLGGEVHYCRLDAFFPAKFILLLMSERVDVMHSHVHHVSGVMTSLAKIARIPTRITHYRSTSAGKRESFFRKKRDAFLRTLINLSATHILAVSKGAMEACWTSFRPLDDRCKVVYNGLDVNRFGNIVESDRVRVQEEFGLGTVSPLFIHVGRFDRAKNHERLVMIFEVLAQQFPDSALLLVGGGDQEREKEIRALVKTKGLNNRVIFAGLRSDVPVLLSLSNCMIFPSLWEGLPGAVLEAAAMGVPVVGSDIPGIIEIGEFTHLIKVVSLLETNEVWGREILNALKHEDDAEDFPLGTPFDIVSTVSTLGAIWSGAKQE